MYKLLFSLCIGTLSAQQVIDPVINYGWLDQYSLNERHHFIGTEACCPTSSTNALTYLQNVAPQIFGTTLSGVTYSDWEATDDTLIALMGTEIGTGTFWNQFVYGLNQYIWDVKDYPEVQFSGIFPIETWSPYYGYIHAKPNYIITGNPTIPFLTKALASGSAVLISIVYPSGFGHELLVNGIIWDEAANNGTLFFVDPLDPSVNYSPDVPEGPVKQTVGAIYLDNGEIHLTYAQYEGKLPYESDKYSETPSTIFGVLSVGGGPFVPFDTLVTGKNAQIVAQAFGTLDPTTYAMLNPMSVLNTTSVNDLESLFTQLDPSNFNSILFAEQHTAEQIRSVITNNFIQYRHPCFDSCDRCSSLNAFITPFGQGLHQRKELNYRDNIYGFIAGVDYFFDQILVGSGFSYANNELSGNAHAHINNYGGFLYTAFVGSPLFVDAVFALSNSQIKANRELYAVSGISIINPLEQNLTHQNNSNVLTAHLGLIYDLYCKNCIDLWPFLNLDYIYVHQPQFTEENGGVFNQTVLKHWTHLFRTEAGLGFSYYACQFFLHASLSYANVTRFDGKDTTAFFVLNPDAPFTTYGPFPQNNLVCPSLQFGYRFPSDLYRLSLNYRGEYGSNFTSNQFSFEFSTSF